MNTLSETELKQAIAGRCKELILLGCQKLDLQTKGLDLTFSQKGGSGGSASWNKTTQRGTLNFNLALALDNQDEYLNQICPHEVSHILDYWMTGTSSHGDDWKYIMAFCFGRRPDRCHHMDTTGIKYHESRDFVYQCPSCRHEYHLTARLHNRIQSGKRGAACSHCNARPTVQFLYQDTRLVK